MKSSIYRKWRGKLEEECEGADDNSEKCHTFNEGCDYNHVASDITGGFGLTGYGFHSGGTDFTNAETGADCCDTCAKRCAKTYERCDFC